MNTIKKNLITVESHCLQLCYASIRFHTPAALQQLITSLEHYRQLVPVVIVPSKQPEQWVLIDGYLRAKALRFIGSDTLCAEIWECEPADALCVLFTEHQSRAWESIEEALLLRELHIQHGLSQPEISTRIGRDQSWISRRLSLLEYLSETVVRAIVEGRLSSWVAQRVLVPMARAKSEDAEFFLQYLLKNPLSSREAQLFYEYYQRSNRQQRIHMVNDPDLFFKAHRWKQAEKIADTVRAGPEGAWKHHCKSMTSAIEQLFQLIPQILPLRKISENGDFLVDCFQKSKTQFSLLDKTIQEVLDAQ
jgi:ParB family transcriptional regulator, chromosome partitioning protein